MNHRQRLKALLVERSLHIGDSTLARGARSSYYIDARRTTLSAEGLYLTGKVCWEALQDSALVVSHVGGLTLGADPVAYAMAYHSWLEGSPLDAFTVRKEPLGQGTGTQLPGKQIEGSVPEGARCLVVEDSMTTGGSALKACAVLQEAGAEVVAILALVDREEGAREHIQTSGFPLIAVYTGRELLKAAGMEES